MRKVLAKEFFNRPTAVVARALLGKYLVRRRKGEVTAAMITETESYDGPLDLAAHSARGRTARTEVLFGPPGVWYVYFIYGMHEMLNIVTKKDGAAVLIRGVEGMAGPGKITKTLGITRELNKKPTTRATGLWIEDRGVKIKGQEVVKGPRVGVDYAGPVWSQKPWRFRLTNKKSGGRSPRS